MIPSLTFPNFPLDSGVPAAYNEDMLKVTDYCTKCGDFTVAYGFTAEGWVCQGCSPWLRCDECQHTLPAELVATQPDMSTMCHDCLVEVGARQAQALLTPRVETEVGW